MHCLSTKKGNRHARALSAILCLAFAGFVFALSAAELPTSRHAFTVIAHRGNHAHAHENTLTALQRAIDAGVDYAEIDVRRTADGHYILLHDATVNRMTDGHGPVAELTLAQLKALRVRDAKRPELPADRVPTLEEALTLAKGRLNLYLDFKAGDRAEVAKIIRDAGVERQILVYDEPEAVSEWRRLQPALPLIVSPPANVKTPGALVTFAKKAGIEVLDSDWRRYTREMINEARNAGLQVWPDIQDGEETAEYYARVVAVGFTGVQTDHPEQLVAWLKQQGLR